MNSKTKTTIRSIAAIAALLTVSAAMANGTTPLSRCVDRVVASCNQGNHPVPCTNSGIDQCEKQHGAQIHSEGFDFAATQQSRLGVQLMLVL